MVNLSIPTSVSAAATLESKVKYPTFFLHRSTLFLFCFLLCCNQISKLPTFFLQNQNRLFLWFLQKANPNQSQNPHFLCCGTTKIQFQTFYLLSSKPKFISSICAAPKSLNPNFDSFPAITQLSGEHDTLFLCRNPVN